MSQLDEILILTNQTGKLEGVTPSGVRQVTNIFEQIYKFFKGLIKNNDLLETTKVELHSKRCIWLPNKLLVMYPQQCSITLIDGLLSDSLLPYLCDIPYQFRTNILPLAEILSIKETFNIQDYINVLQELHCQYPNEPLTQSDLNISLCIINCCLTVHIENDEDLLNIMKDSIYIPNSKSVLA